MTGQVIQNLELAIKAGMPFLADPALLSRLPKPEEKNISLGYSLLLLCISVGSQVRDLDIQLDPGDAKVLVQYSELTPRVLQMWVEKTTSGQAADNLFEGNREISEVTLGKTVFNFLLCGERVA